MNKILIATPMLPPTLGGPGIHAEKLHKHFSQTSAWHTSIFVFEKLNKYPAGLRHVIAFYKILRQANGVDVILALDGFSVALPSLLVAALTRKKLILRIGGDLVHEQYVEKHAIDMESFYKKIAEKKFLLPKILKLKLRLQKYVVESANGIIFTSKWQEDIYKDYYVIPKNTWVIKNPAEYTDLKLKSQEASQSSEKIFLSVSRDVEFKNIKMLRKVFAEVSKTRTDISLDTNKSSREKLLKRMLGARCYINVSLSDISPNTVLDAISLRLPVILTKNTGFYEILEDSGMCRFVDPFDQKDIETAILEMCDDHTWSLYKKAAEYFRWPQTWQTLFLEYENALSDILK